MVMVFLCHIRRLCDIPNDNHAIAMCILFPTGVYSMLSFPRVRIGSLFRQVVGSIGAGDALTSAQKDRRWIAARRAASTSQRRKPGARPSILKLESSTGNDVSFPYTPVQGYGMVIAQLLSSLTIEKAFDVEGVPSRRQPRILRATDIAGGNVAGGDIHLRCTVV